MWRVRQKELELNDRLKKRSKDVSGSDRNQRDVDNSARSTSKRLDDNASTSYISSKRVMENCYARKDEGLRDEEVEEFLHLRYVCCSLFLSHSLSLTSLCVVLPGYIFVAKSSLINFPTDCVWCLIFIYGLC